MENDVSPIFLKARPVPYAIKPKVDAELDRLEKQGILTKVDWSDWATPIVPVAKKSGSVRICGDFKITINPVMKAEQYPLPRIEDIFANLCNGKQFTIIDLVQAYHQMAVAQEDRHYLIINAHKVFCQYSRLVFGIKFIKTI